MTESLTGSEPIMKLRVSLLLSSSASCDSSERRLDQCLQCHDTLSLYRQALRMTLSSLATDRERRAATEVGAPSPAAQDAPRRHECV